MKRQYPIAVDFGGTHLRMALVEVPQKGGRIRILAKKEGASLGMGNPNRFMDEIQTRLLTLLKEAGVSRRRIKGIGIGVPGSVDVQKGVVHFLPNLAGWKRVPLVARLKRRLKLPVKIDNDGNAMALGECRWGAARNAQNAVFLTLGTGIGGGLLLGGKLHHGRHFSACEIAHLRIRQNGVRCVCGSKGCLETEIGRVHLLRKVRLAMRRASHGILYQRFKKRGWAELDLPDVTRAASQGDAFAIRFWKETGEILGDFLGGICNLLSPEVIVIGGGISKAGSFLFNPLRRTLKQNAFPAAAAHVRVVPARFGPDAGLVGAASLITCS